MATSTRLSLAQSQRQTQTLEQHQLQALECLQRSTAELETWLSEQAERVPGLRVERRPPRGPEEGAWWNHVEDSGEDLLAEVALEIRTHSAPVEVREWALFLLSQLDPRGQLGSSDAHLLALGSAAGLPSEHEQLALGIGLLQACGRRGLGARNTEEALLLQLDSAAPHYALLCRVIEDSLEDLVAGRHALVASRCGVEEAVLVRALAELRHLHLGTLAEERRADGIRPELDVRLESGDVVVTPLRGSLPEVRVDEDLSALLRQDSLERTQRRAMRSSLDEARRVVEAVQQRQRTLALVGGVVFRAQRRWLAGELRRPAPLTMGEVAQELGLATSTISRAVAGKHASTPRGLVPLRELFSQAVAGASRDQVRDRVAELVEREDPAQPLSDEELMEGLRVAGFEVARRTIAKYRKELGIPSSYRRRRAADSAAA